MLRFGILSTAKIGRELVVPAIQDAENCVVTAIASRDLDRARQMADRFSVPHAFGSYEEMLASDTIDAVYIPLPTSQHVEWTIKAADAGKHVLCEKPMSISIDDAKAMIDTCQSAGRKLMIAYRLRHDPYHQTLIELVQKQAYGKLKMIATENNQSTKAPNIRLSKSTRGGPLGDVGIYCLNATRYLTSEEPTEFQAMKVQPKDDPRFAEVPSRYVWTERFPSGIVATCGCSFDTALGRPLTLYFEKAVVELQNAYAYRGQRMFIREEEKIHEIIITPVNQFAAEMDHFSSCITENKTPWTPGEEGLRDEKHLREIEEAADSGKIVKATV